MKIVEAVTLDRPIITAMVVSTRFLREIKDIYSPEFLTAPFSRTVAQWCLDHFDKHGSAPSRHIQDIFQSNVARKKIKEEVKTLIEKFLASISADFDSHGGEGGINIDFLLEEALRWFRKRDLEHLTRELEHTLENSGPDEAEELLRKHEHISAIQLEGFDPIRDANVTKEVFETPPEPLFGFDGAVGQLLNNQLVRESLIGIMAPEKSGKTFLLTDLTKRACMNRCNVALFELGDMSSSQIKRRLYSSLCGMPSAKRWTSETTVPVIDCWFSQLGECPTGQHDSLPVRDDNEFALPETPPGYNPCPHCGKCRECKPTAALVKRQWKHEMTEADVLKTNAKLASYMGNSRLRFCVKANNTFTAEMINDTLTQWKEKLGFIPDVIGIDYDATMARERGAKDEREGLNEQWKWFRRLSQEWKACVMANTQTDGDALDRENLSLANYSGDKRKYSHVTGMLGIHGTRQEFKMGLSRLSWMLGREEEYGVDDQVVTLRHLRISRPVVGSFWRDRMYRPKMLKKLEVEGE